MSNKALKIFFFQNLCGGITYTVFGILIPVISKHFSIGLDFIGLLLSLNAACILISSLLSGNLSELLGKKKLIVIGNILVIISFIGIFFSHKFIYFLINYLIFGIGIGMIFVNVDSIICENFKEKSSQKLLINSIGYMVGTILTTFIISIFLHSSIAWEYIFLLVGLINIPILIFLINLKLPASQGEKTASMKVNLINIFIVNKKLFLKPTIIISIIIAIIYFGILSSFSAWFTSFFLILEVPVKISSIFQGIYQVSIIFGLLFKKMLLRKLEDEKIIFINAILALIFLSGVLLVPNLILKNILIFLFGLNFGGFQALIISIAMSNSYEHSGSIASLVYGFSWGGIILFQYITGYLSEKFTVKSMIYISQINIFLIIIFSCLLIFLISKSSKIPSHKVKKNY